MLKKSSFELTCIESSPGHEQQAPCEGLLTVCQWPTVKAPTSDSGTYWAGENMGLSDLLGYLGGRGFSLPALSNE